MVTYPHAYSSKKEKPPKAAILKAYRLKLSIQKQRYCNTGAGAFVCAESFTLWSVDTALSDDAGVEADRLESETLPRSAGAFVDGSFWFGTELLDSTEVFTGVAEEALDSAGLCA